MRGEVVKMAFRHVLRLVGFALDALGKVSLLLAYVVGAGVPALINKAAGLRLFDLKRDQSSFWEYPRRQGGASKNFKPF